MFGGVPVAEQRAVALVLGVPIPRAGAVAEHALVEPVRDRVPPDRGGGGHHRDPGNADDRGRGGHRVGPAAARRGARVGRGGGPAHRS